MYLYAGSVAAIAIAFVASSPQGSWRFAPAFAQSAGDAKPVTETWAAVAPGRVQPRGGELRLSGQASAPIKDVLVQVSDRVKPGDLLVQFEDSDVWPKLAVAKADLSLKTQERDNVPATGAALDRRKAEDAVFAAERDTFEAQIEFDRLSTGLRSGTAAVGEVERARSSLQQQQNRLQAERAQSRKVTSSTNAPAYGREEAALIAARADTIALYNAIERTKVRTPKSAMVLDVNARVGEMPNGDTPLVLLGDTTQLQIRAELEERDIQKVFTGQRTVVRTDTFQGRSFEGRVSAVAKALTSPQLSSKNKRGPADIDVLEVTVELQEPGPLLPGMRVDVYFRPTDAAQTTSTRTQ